MTKESLAGHNTRNNANPITVSVAVVTAKGGVQAPSSASGWELAGIDDAECFSALAFQECHQNNANHPL